MTKSIVSDKFLRFWNAPDSSESLALGRIILGTIQFYRSFTLTEKFQEFSLFPEILFQPIFFLKLFSLQTIAPPKNTYFLGAIGFGLMVSGICTIIGYKTKINIFIFFLIQFFLVGFSYSFGDYHHDQAVPILVGFLLFFTPCDRKFSLDVLLNKATFRSIDEPFDHRTYGWFFQFIKCFLGIVYFSAGISKLAHSQGDWLTGRSLIYFLEQDGIANSRPLGIWLSRNPYLCILLAWATIVFQMLFVFAIHKRKWKTMFTSAGIVFHLSTDLIMKANFTGFIGVLSFLLPWEKILRFKNTYLPPLSGPRKGWSDAIC
ncbi:hypothetical protein EBQ74_00350 [bacterium]|nr:hypothetical protein [bacterium]